MRRRRRSSNGPVIATVAIAVTIMVGVIVFLAVTFEQKQANRSPDHPPTQSATDTWTHKELLEHLKTNGLECVWIDDGKLSIAMCFKGDYEDEQRLRVFAGPGGLEPISGGYIRVMLCQTEREASELSGSRTHSRYWRRFVFIASDKKLDAIFKRLPH